MLCPAAQHIDRVLSQKCHQALVSSRTQAWTHRSKTNLSAPPKVAKKRQSDRSPRVLPLTSTELSDLETTPVKTEVCGARAELRDECLWIWSPLCAHTGGVPDNAECKSAGFAGVSSELPIGRFYFA